MTDLFQFRSRFGRSTVIAFPFPRDGVWALGFAHGDAPQAVQIDPATTLLMIFVPTAIHPLPDICLRSATQVAPSICSLKMP
jgi:uncharacterized membrane protein